MWTLCVRSKEGNDFQDYKIEGTADRVQEMFDDAKNHLRCGDNPSSRYSVFTPVGWGLLLRTSDIVVIGIHKGADSNQEENDANDKTTV